MIQSFKGIYLPFSNFFQIPDAHITVSIPNGERNGLPKKMSCPTSEHAFMACKTLDPHFRVKIIQAKTPLKAKRLGRKVKLRDDWDTLKFDAMYYILRQKFERSTVCRRVLFSTGDQKLVEGNTWHDNIWENCTCGRPSCLPLGGNALGNTLMRVRKELLNEGF